MVERAILIILTTQRIERDIVQLVITCCGVVVSHGNAAATIAPTASSQRMVGCFLR
jgi:hypothetical protein